MNTLPTSQKQAKLLGEKYYFTGEPCSKGHIAKRLASSFTCAECGKEDQKKRYHANLEKSRERVRLKQAELYKKDPERLLAHARKSTQKYRDKNPLEYRIKNLARYHRGRAKRENRLPKWLTDHDFWVMEEVFHTAQMRTKATGVKWEVDHILPLHGKYVSGLHVPANLQVITRSENKSKHNNFTPE